ncbi:MAG: pyruvate kinase [Pseudomonas fluorescens]|nr:MAG: pyruvate kinase [Pseudomonas fluorescens]
MAKILATLGPSSSTQEQIAALVEAGANAFRLNFSHGTLDDHASRVNAARAVSAATGKQLPLLMDLQGPKIRIGEMAAPVQLERGAQLVLDNDTTPGDGTRVCLPHPQILAVLQVGDTVMVNDGVIQLRVIEKPSDTKAVTQVKAGGALSSRKGVNVPGRALPMSAMTEKDIKDLEGGLGLGVDWVALSFVQTAQDVIECKERINGRAKVMAKIETQAAIENLAEILAEADGLMVARGDLGVELPTEDVPPLQKQMIDMCRKAGKPVVVATQMLESMISSPRPTRAEANDVANAAYDGADCLMLSAESASGMYPVEAIEVMSRIITKAEHSSTWRAELDAHLPSCDKTAGDAVALAASKMADTLGAAGLIAFTESGKSVARLTRLRCAASVIALTPHQQVARQVELNWGVTGLVCPPVTDAEDMVAKAKTQAKAKGLLDNGEMLVVVAGVPFGKAGTTNMVRVVQA